MTCIVGYIDQETKEVIIGADSAGVSGLDITVRKDKKVFRVGDFVIGCTSSFRMLQLLNFSFKPPKNYEKEVYEYMCTDFVDAVRDCFKKGGYLQKFKDGDEKGGFFIVGYKGRLFTIQCDFQVSETLRGYDAIGCGDLYALGSIYTSCTSNKQEKDKEKLVLKALKTASYFSAGVCEPFHIIKNK